MKTTIDKTKELEASLLLVNDKLQFKGHVEGNNPIFLDYIPPLGDGNGYTSMELLLLSFSSCLGTALLTFLRKMQKTIDGFRMEMEGVRNTDHPTGFKSITVKIFLTSPDIYEAEVNKIIKLAEDTYCPVWAMVRGNVEVITQVTIDQK